MNQRFLYSYGMSQKIIQIATEQLHTLLWLHLRLTMSKRGTLVTGYGYGYGYGYGFQNPVHLQSPIGQHLLWIFSNISGVAASIEGSEDLASIDRNKIL